MTELRSRRRRGRLLAVSLVGLGLVAGACGSSGKKTSTTTAAAAVPTTVAPAAASTSAAPPTTAQTAALTTAAPTTVVKADKPVVGGELKVGLESGVSTLDPAQSLAQPADKDIALAIYDPLVSFDKDDKFVPYLAEDFKASADLLTWTVKLRKGIKFHDGTDFNADAVVAHWLRMADPATGSPWATSAAQEKPTKVDDLTVDFKMDAPNIGFPNDMATAMGYIPSPTAVAKDPTGFGLAPVGTGPFKLTTFEAKGQVVVSKNPSYWKKDADGTQLPYLDKITFIPYPDTAKRLEAVKAGEVDVIQTADTSTVVDAAKQKNLKVQKVTGSSSTNVLFNNKKAPLDDVNVRTALALATDRDALNQTIYSGGRVEAYSGYAPNSPYKNPAADEPKFNLDAAKKLIAAYGKPVDITLECIPTPEADQILQLLKEQWEAAGAKVTLKSQEQGAYVARIFGKGGDYQAACFRTNQFVEPDQVRSSIFTDDKANLLFYSNPGVDKAMTDGRGTTDFEKRKAAYFQAQALFVKDVPTIYLLFDLFGNISSDKVSDMAHPEGNSLGAIKFTEVYKKK